MDNNTLDHLLEIEASAAEMVNDALKEADRRVRENDEEKRAAFEEYLKTQAHRHQSLLNEEIEKIKNQYNKTLNDYRMEISRVNADVRGFSALLNKYLLQG